MGDVQCIYKRVVKEIVQNKKISIEWGNPSTTVDFEFTEVTQNTTYVIIKHYGFKETGNQLVQVIKDSTGGFTTVLDGLKCYLEHNIQLNLIADKYSRNVTDHK